MQSNLGCTEDAFGVVLCILLAGTGVRKISSAASWSSPIKIHYFDYSKRFINRIDEVSDFSIKYRYSDILLKNINFIYNRLFCNHTYYCVGMVSVTSASRYVTSASRYQSRSSMYMRGLILRNWPRQFRLPHTDVILSVAKHSLFRNDMSTFMSILQASCADPEGVVRGSGPHVENHKLYGFLYRN